MNKKFKVKFAPGAFDSFEGTQEELNELIASITQNIESGELLENSAPVDIDELEKNDPELAAHLKSIIFDTESRKRNLN